MLFAFLNWCEAKTFGPERMRSDMISLETHVLLVAPARRLTLLEVIAPKINFTTCIINFTFQIVHIYDNYISCDYLFSLQYGPMNNIYPSKSDTLDVCRPSRSLDASLC